MQRDPKRHGYYLDIPGIRNTTPDLRRHKQSGGLSRGYVRNPGRRKRAFRTLAPEADLKHRIQDCEDAGVKADAERERDHGHGSEARVLQQLAKSEFKVIHGSWSVVSGLLSVAFRASRLIRSSAPPSDRLLQHALQAA